MTRQLDDAELAQYLEDWAKHIRAGGPITVSLKQAEKLDAAAKALRSQPAGGRDAERYRWLRDTHHLRIGPDAWIRTGEDLDDAVDEGIAAMKESAK